MRDVYRYVVATGEWQSLTALSQPARFHSLFLMGMQVLIAAENPQVYDLASQSVVRSPPLGQLRRYARGVQLRSGNVLAIGGEPLTVDGMTPYDLVDEYVPGASSWMPRPPLSTPRGGSGAVTLNDGTVLVAGGFASFTTDPNDAAQQTAERYVPAANTWYAEAPAPAATGGAAVLLDDGSVLFVSSYLARFYPKPWL